MKKLYEVNGVLEYAHCFREEVLAESAKEAQKIINDKLSNLSDPAMAEFQGGIVDLGVEIEDDAESTKGETQGEKI